MFSGTENDREKGVAMICNKIESQSIIGLNPVSKRMLAVRFKGQPVNLTIIQVYAQTSAADINEIDDFFADLQQLIDKAPASDILMVMGDFNAKVGKADGETGKHGLRSRIEAGENLVEFSGANDLFICNTWFEQPERRLYTWTAPNGLYRNQIDYIMIKKRWSSSVQAVKTLPGACCDSDHELLCSTVRIKLRKIRKTTIP